MALETIAPHYGKGHARLAGQLAGSTYRILRELQGLRIQAVVGAAAATNIAIADITTEDTLISVLAFNRNATAANINFSSVTDASITSNGNIQTATTITSGDALLVFWFDKSGAAADKLEDLLFHFGRAEARTDVQRVDSLYTILRELQNFRVSAVAGANTTVDVAIPGRTDADPIAYVGVLFRNATASSINIVPPTGGYTEQSNGSIRTQSTNYTGSTLLVFWWDKSGGYRTENASMASIKPIPPYFTKGQSALSGQLPQKSLHYWLRELQAFQVSVVAGADGSTTAADITLPGFVAGRSHIISMLRFNSDTTASNINISGYSAYQVSDTGTLQVTSDVSGDQLLVFWLNVT